MVSKIWIEKFTFEKKFEKLKIVGKVEKSWKIWAKLEKVEKGGKTWKKWEHGIKISYLET